MAEKKSEFTIIPASQRPDGTWRREIKVRAGYIPPDEMERYQSRGRQSGASNNGLPPGMAVDDKTGSKKTKNQKKNERKKLKKQETAAKNDDIETRDALEEVSLVSEVGKMQIKDTEEEKSPNMSKDALSKKLKNLKKKLRQIEELENKISTNEVKDLSKEQNDKIARKKDILDEIEDVELDLKLCDD